MLTFPDSPSADDAYTDADGGEWVYDGVAWNRNRDQLPASSVRVLDVGENFTGTSVEAALNELVAQIADSQAVEIVASNATTGRYAVQGPNGVLEQGDTGWRDISSALANGWAVVDNGLGSTDGRFQIRRVGSKGMLRIHRLSAASATSVGVITDMGASTPGFNASFNQKLSGLVYSSGLTSPTAQVSVGAFISAIVLRFDNTITAEIGGIIEWPISAAWPSALPGTQATAPGVA